MGLTITLKPSAAWVTYLWDHLSLYVSWKALHSVGHHLLVVPGPKDIWLSFTRIRAEVANIQPLASLLKYHNVAQPQMKLERKISSLRLYYTLAPILTLILTVLTDLI